MYSIVDHLAYSGMPATKDDEGKIDWIIPTGRKPGSKNWDGNSRRREWWRQKAGELGIEIGGYWISRTAKALHPFNKKPCQTCGRIMRLEYAYPNVRTIEQLNRFLPEDSELSFSDFLEVGQVIDHFENELGEGAASTALIEVFPELADHADADIGELKEQAERLLVQRESRKLSPGAMSNAPDRLDGFHTYNLCCRSKEDTGRATENLKTYGVDRRAFEHWSQGDWAAANALMTQPGVGICPRCGSHAQLTADHIGPISLGFRHTPHFEAVCLACNSAKSNRMSHRDVERLIELERTGHEVVSWQAKQLWDELNGRVRDDEDALRLSKLLNVNQHHYLRLLVDAREAGVPDALLQFLSPQYSEERIEFIGLDPLTLSYDEIVRHPRQTSYALGIAARLVRIAFESLDDYAKKETRNVQVVPVDRLDTADAALDAIEQAIRAPSSWREPLNRALDGDLSATARTSALLTLLSGGYGPVDEFGYVAAAFEDLMADVGSVLAGRLEDDRAIKEWDDRLVDDADLQAGSP